MSPPQPDRRRPGLPPKRRTSLLFLAAASLVYASDWGRRRGGGLSAKWVDWESEPTRLRRDELTCC